MHLSYAFYFTLYFSLYCYLLSVCILICVYCYPSKLFPGVSNFILFALIGIDIEVTTFVTWFNYVTRYKNITFILSLCATGFYVLSCLPRAFFLFIFLGIVIYISLPPCYLYVQTYCYFFFSVSSLWCQYCHSCFHSLYVYIYTCNVLEVLQRLFTRRTCSLHLAFQTLYHSYPK